MSVISLEDGTKGVCDQDVTAAGSLAANGIIPRAARGRRARSSGDEVDQRLDRGDQRGGQIAIVPDGSVDPPPHGGWIGNAQLTAHAGLPVQPSRYLGP